MKRKKKKTCACGGASYETCCKPFHEGAEPDPVEKLVRARFTGFVLGKTEFLWRTLHADHDDRSGGFEAFAERMKGTAGVEYRALEILDTRPPDDSGAARVLFHVSARMGGDASFLELSWFVRDDVGWRYLVGKPETPPANWRSLRIKDA